MLPLLMLAVLCFSAFEFAPDGVAEHGGNLLSFCLRNVIRCWTVPPTRRLPDPNGQMHRAHNNFKRRNRSNGPVGCMDRTHIFGGSGGRRGRGHGGGPRDGIRRSTRLFAPAALATSVKRNDRAQPRAPKTKRRGSYTQLQTVAHLC